MKEEIVVSEDGEIIEPAPVPLWLGNLPVVEDMATAIGERITKATTMDEALGDLSEPIGLESVTGQALTVHSAALAPSDTENAIGYYALIDATVEETGERVVITCGAQGVLRVLAKAADLGAYPFKCKPYGVASKVKGRSDALRLGTVDKF
jgi:hypothetical protein